MKKFVVGLLVFVVILIGVIAAAPFLIPASTYGRVAEENLEAMLGRDVTLSSDPQISIFPRLGATIENVEIANAEGYPDPYFARADSLSIAVKWLPLFSRRVEISSLRFEGGEILLHQRTATDNNWTFASADTTPPEEVDTNDETQAQSFDAIIPRADLSNMRVRYTDDVSGNSYDANPINLTARLDGLNAPASIQGDITVNEERFAIEGRLSSIDALTRGAPAQIDAKIESAILDAGYNGTVSLSEDIALSGEFNFASDDLGRMTRFADIPTEQNLTALGRVRASGNIAGTLNALTITGLTASQDSSNLKTDFDGTIAMTAGAPSITGSLTSRSSKLRDFLSALNIELPEMQSGALDSFNADLALSSLNSVTTVTINSLSIDDIDVAGSIEANLQGQTPSINATLEIPKLDVSPYLSESRTAQSQAPAQGGWSEDPIDLSVLHAANGSFDISIGELTDLRARILDVTIKGDLNRGRFVGSLDSIPPESGRTGRPTNIDPLYSGQLLTSLVLQSLSNGANTLEIEADGSGITAAALVRFFTGQEVLQGIASIDADVQMNGRSVADFVRSMSGNYRADVADGAILGINLPQLLRSAQTFIETRSLPNALSPEAETDFSSLELQGQIQNGVAEVQTFNLIAPFLRATAEGDIDLYNQTLDLHIYPRALTSATGTGENGVQGYGIPLVLSGTWSAPRGSLDTDFIANLATNAVRDRIADEARSRLGDDVVGGLIGDALGIGRDDTETTTPETDDEASSETELAETPEEETQDVENVARDLFRDIISRPRD